MDCSANWAGEDLDITNRDYQRDQHVYYYSIIVRGIRIREYLCKQF